MLKSQIWVFLLWKIFMLFHYYIFFIAKLGSMLCIANACYLYFWFYVVCRPSIKIPAFVIMPIAHMAEGMYNLLAPYGMKVPQLTPSRIRLLTCSWTFNCSKANDRLGYTPIVSLQVFPYPITWVNFDLVCLTQNFSIVFNFSKISFFSYFLV